MQYAVAAALRGDRSHQVSFRAALTERAAITTTSLNAIPGVTCVAPTAGFYAMPKVTLPPGRTDEDYVLPLLRATGVLCVLGLGSTCPPPMGSCGSSFSPRRPSCAKSTPWFRTSHGSTGNGV